MPAEPVVAYVVMCHHKRDQVLRLVGAIRRSSPRARVLIRHDQGTGFIDEADAADAGAELLVSAVRGRWGDWSLVEAALEAFAHARARFAADWFVLVSGQDYPVRDLDAWERELLAGDVDAVVAGEPLVTGPLGLRLRDDEDGLRLRYTHRWRRAPQLGIVPRLPGIVPRVVRAVWFRHLFGLQAVLVLNKLPRDEGWLVGVRRRKVPFSPATPAWKGEQWLALSRRGLAAVLDTERAAAWQAYFATTMVPDESFFATTLHDAPDVRVRQEGISWTHWGERLSPHPLIMTRDSLPQARRAGMPFARKFDEDVAPGLLDTIDAELAQRRP